jgi:hypothetical protein
VQSPQHRRVALLADGGHSLACPWAGAGAALRDIFGLPLFANSVSVAVDADKLTVLDQQSGVFVPIRLYRIEAALSAAVAQMFQCPRTVAEPDEWGRTERGFNEMAFSDIVLIRKRGARQ